MASKSAVIARNSSLFGITPSMRDSFLTILILSLTCVLAFSVRLFSVLRYESVIHEFDPYFNFRGTKYLIKYGIYAFQNWFDDFSWYPLGRIVGGTVYPGIQLTAGFLYFLSRLINFTIDIRNICVLCAPLFSAFTVLSCYFFTKAIHSRGAGLISAIFIAIVPGYISRSVAGSFDCEGVAITALIATFWLWIRSVKSGSIQDAVLLSLSYFYMVNAWGGYVFIINLIPLYVLAMLLTGNYSQRLYVAYSVFYVCGTFLSMQVRFVSFMAVQGGEHMGALGVFGILQIYSFMNWLKYHLGDERIKRLTSQIVAFGFFSAIGLFVVGTATGYISPWTGRFYSMLDPTYAKNHIPIIASVSEHQPTTWASYFFDLHILTMFFPVGLYFCMENLTEESLFIIVYGMTSVYFSGVMVRLMLVLAPAACVLSAIGISKILYNFSGATRKRMQEDIHAKNSTKATPKKYMPAEFSGIVLLAVLSVLVYFVLHCTWVTSEAYSSPSIVLAARAQHGRVIFDDFREAYKWLSQNTAPDAKVMSWWDYGYQITAMANRTILVDNNTWNNTHIATVGTAMASREKDAYQIMRRLDVSYVLVIFGGVTGYQSDDINKFLWMVRIGGSVNDYIKEPNYLTQRGEYRIDSQGSETMLNSMMYKMCFYRFGEMNTQYQQPPGFDRVRNAVIGNLNFELEYIEEAFSSENFIVRIYKVKDEPNRLAERGLNTGRVGDPKYREYK